MQIASDNAYMSNCNFTYNHGGTSEGVFWWNGVNGTMDICNFINNTAKTYSGAITFSGVHSKISNSNFINNTAGTNNGAMQVDGNSITIDNCTFINNTATDGQGGAINSHVNALSVFNSTFIDNSASNSGDAIYVVSGNSICEVGNTFINNDNDFTDAVMLENRDFYVSPDGYGLGTSPEDATSFDYAYAKIAHSNKIIFTTGTYYNIVNQTIGKTLTLEGQNGAVIDLNGSGRAFSVSAYKTIKTIFYTLI